MPIISRPFDTYDVVYQAHKNTHMAGQIRCLAGAEVVGVLTFSTPVTPSNTVVDDDVLILQYTLESFPAVLDLVRNEKPLTVNMSTDDFRGWVGTVGVEPVGEGE